MTICDKIPLSLIRFTYKLFPNGTSGVITWPKYRLKHRLSMGGIPKVNNESPGWNCKNICYYYIYYIGILSENMCKLCFKCLVICFSPRGRNRIRETKDLKSAKMKQLWAETQPNAVVLLHYIKEQFRYITTYILKVWPSFLTLIITLYQNNC